jgi:hypothetical protein
VIRTVRISIGQVEKGWKRVEVDRRDVHRAVVDGQHSPLFHQRLLLVERERRVCETRSRLPGNESTPQVKTGLFTNMFRTSRAAVNTR